MSAKRKQDLMTALKVFAPAVLLTLGAFLLAYQFVDPAPPSRLIIATGSAEGAYAAFAERYRVWLERQGIELEIRHTRGSVDNLALLASGQADIAFVQGGLEGKTDEGLLSLGSLYLEPVWLFHRADGKVERVADLNGLRLAIGAEGSGTRRLALTLLRDNAALTGGIETVDLGGREAVEALQAATVDAALFVSGPESPLIQELVRAPGVTLMNFRRAAAYTRLHPYLSHVVLPEGMIDMPGNIPDRDINMLAVAATLVTRAETHPALLDQVLQAARSVHEAGGWFGERGRFPSPDYLTFPLSPEAERFYAHGPPFLQRYLPFWAATLVDRLKVMLLPLVMILLPLLRIMPPVYNWRMRARTYRWYKELEGLEERVREGLGAAEKRQVAAELERLDRDVQKMHVPLSFAAQSYDLRLHIALVRQSLNDGESDGRAA